MSEDVITKIIDRFESKIDAIVNKLTDLEIKIATSAVQKDAQDKICEIHSNQINEIKIGQEAQDTRITTLETASCSNKSWIVVIIAIIAAIGAWVPVFVNR